jgi:hypothetical protein
LSFAGISVTGVPGVVDVTLIVVVEGFDGEVVVVVEEIAGFVTTTAALETRGGFTVETIRGGRFA